MKIALPVKATRSIMLILFLFVIGCSSSFESTREIYPVDGEFTWNHQPAAGAIVTFHPREGKDDKTNYSCTVTSQGRFVPLQNDGGIGIPEGVYDLTAVWLLDGVDRFEGRYSNVSIPLKTITVQPSVNLLEPVHLIP